MSESREHTSILEALLFLSGEVLAVSSFKEILGLPEAEIKKIMDKLVAEYKERNAGLLIVEIANG